MTMSKVTGASNHPHMKEAADLRAATAKTPFADLLKGDQKVRDELGKTGVAKEEPEPVLNPQTQEECSVLERQYDESIRLDDTSQIEETTAEDEEDIEEFKMMSADAQNAGQLTGEALRPLQADAQPVQAYTGPQARHEVVERLIEAMVVDGKLGEDANGRKVMMMDIQCPGRGNVRVRLWKKEDGIELRIRADNPELKSLILMGRSELQSSAKQRGVVFSKIEVA